MFGEGAIFLHISVKSTDGLKDTNVLPVSGWSTYTMSASCVQGPSRAGDRQDLASILGAWALPRQCQCSLGPASGRQYWHLNNSSLPAGVLCLPSCFSSCPAELFQGFLVCLELQAQYSHVLKVVTPVSCFRTSASTPSSRAQALARASIISLETRCVTQRSSS